jgi:5-methylthioadenosine/S-adenosylhomocysteine deaminase
MADTPGHNDNSILIRGGHIVTNDAGQRVLDPGCVLIRAGGISAIWRDGDLDTERAANIPPGTVEIDARRSIVIPGLVNAHMHSNESFEQGAYDRFPLETWLIRCYPPFGAPRLSARDQYLRSMLCAIQTLRSGVTTLQDDFLDDDGTGGGFDAVAAAYRDVGLRAVITTSFLDTPFLDGRPFLRELIPAALAAELPEGSDWRRQIATFERNRAGWNRPGGLTSVILGPISPQRCTRDLLHAVADLSEAGDIPVHCHVDETRTQALTSRVFFGTSLVDHLESVGLLTHRLTLNHAIWLTENDVRKMGERRVSITHNPLSNLKLGSGICNLAELLEAGVNIALGTDGTSTSDTADLIGALRVAAILHRPPNTPEDRWISAHDAFRMATVGGAVSTGMEDSIGRIEVGRQGDIALLDRRHLAFVPLHDAIRQLAFSATSEAVHTVIVQGRIVLRDRKLTLIDEDAIREEIIEAAERFRRDSWSRMQDGAARVVPYIEQMLTRARATEMSDRFINARDQPRAPRN